ncbi:hypothetical protein PVK06_023643 [Gossypium arboreum]|uniref:Uncharacterized protein n=1 Tax=Gossypium arboreum TaxID=29729 RepID=A0ABR0PC63_GOSAR|nr:hypothetical protein PVK06_023643 [Gossypium arboreum]
MLVVKLLALLSGIVKMDVASEEFFKNPSFLMWVGTLEDDISAYQATMSSIRSTINALVEVSVEHDVLKLEDELHLTIVKHYELSRDVQQKCRVEDQDEIVIVEDNASASIDIEIEIGLEVNVYDEPKPT